MRKEKQNNHPDEIALKEDCIAVVAVEIAADKIGEEKSKPVDGVDLGES